jgi:hypothetical protein
MARTKSKNLLSFSSFRRLMVVFWGGFGRREMAGKERKRKIRAVCLQGDRHKKGEKKGKAIEGRVKLRVYMLGNVQWIKGRKDNCTKDGFSCIIEGKGENSSQVE